MVNKVNLSKTKRPQKFLSFFFSAVEQPEVVFSVEQLRSGQAESPALAPEDCGAADKCDYNPDSERPTETGQTEDMASNPPSSAAQLFFKLKEKPEELLQLAPEAGDVVPLTGETVQRPIFCDFFFFSFTSLTTKMGSSYCILLKVSLSEVSIRVLLSSAFGKTQP